MDIKLTPREVWISTWMFAIASLILVVPQLALTRADQPANMTFPILLGSGAFWAIMSVLFVRRFWDVYYGYFYPDWVKSIWPLSPIVYMAIGAGIWRMAITIKPHSLISFAVIGGLEGVAEHILAVYGFRVLEKVPFLQGLKPVPVLLFSFFEYIFYWAIVGWLAIGVAFISDLF